MKVWDVKPPSKLQLEVARAQARRRAKQRRDARENHERNRIRRLINSFETRGVIIGDIAMLLIVDRTRPENSHVIVEKL